MDEGDAQQDENTTEDGDVTLFAEVERRVAGRLLGGTGNRVRVGIDLTADKRVERLDAGEKWDGWLNGVVILTDQKTRSWN